MLNFFKTHVSSLLQTISSSFQTLFTNNIVNEQMIQSIKEILIKADTGIITTNKIIENLTKKIATTKLNNGGQLQQALAEELNALLSKNQAKKIEDSNVFLLVGINGSGKTTFVAKLANIFIQQKRSCLIVAADTFRAAASQQLHNWTKKIQAPIFIGKPNQDPASVVFDACKQFQTNQHSALIIDTAGRLQNKEYLMAELAKIKKTILKVCPEAKISTLLTIDAMLGQNSLDQARLFHDLINIDSIVLTKMDGTGKGGIVFAIADQLALPVQFICWGENIDDIAFFDPQKYINNLLSIDQS